MSMRILKFPRGDDEAGKFVLVQVASAGSRPLDLKVVCTEGLWPYVVHLRHSRAATLKSKASKIEDDEWLTILESVLRADGPEDIQVAAAVDVESSVTLTVRRRLDEEVTIRLGALVLKFKEEERIELFDWCSATLDANSQAQARLASSEAKNGKLETELREANAQMEELIAARGEDEKAMLEKFCLLLNEKKAKVRELQKLLSSVNIGASSAAREVSSTGKAKSGAHRTPGPSRPGKRKAPAAETALHEEEATEGDQMNIDDDDDDDNEEQEDRQTTASEGSETDEEMPVGRAAGSRATRASPAPRPPKAATPTPPPQRRQAVPTRSRKRTPVPAEGSETESDDEL